MTTQEGATTANELVKQIKFGVKASLGYHQPMCDSRTTDKGETQYGLTFKAKILPFKKNGERASGARIMRVSIYVNGLDYYDITVGWLRGTEWVQHFETTNVDVSSLNACLLSLDYDGPTVTNSAYWFTAEEQAAR